VAGVTDRDATGFFKDNKDDLRDAVLAAGDVVTSPLTAMPLEPLIPDSLVSEIAFTPVTTAVALLAVGTAGFARLPQSQLVTELAVLGFSASCLAGISFACAAIRVAMALVPPPVKAG